MSTLIAYTLIIAIGLNLVFFIIAYSLQTDKLTDMTYSLTFIAIAVTGLVYSEKHLAHYIMAGLIVAWAVRLGGFLMRRVHAIGRDDRFDSLRPYFFKFLGFWTMQALTCVLVSISALLVFANQNPKLDLIFFLGVGIALVGLGIETIADNQKYKFKNNFPDKFMQTGLWKKIRHPNYTGEIIFWIGLSIAALSSSYGYLAFLSPIWISFILIRFSGIPLLREKWENRYGLQEEFKDYKERSWYLFPYIY